MYDKILRMAVEKAIKSNDKKFMSTTVFKEICCYIGESVPSENCMTVFAYAEMRGRNYRSCKNLSVTYNLGTLFGGMKLLNQTEVEFLDTTRRKNK